MVIHPVETQQPPANPPCLSLRPDCCAVAPSYLLHDDSISGHVEVGGPDVKGALGRAITEGQGEQVHSRRRRHHQDVLPHRGKQGRRWAHNQDTKNSQNPEMTSVVGVHKSRTLMKSAKTVSFGRAKPTLTTTYAIRAMQDQTQLRQGSLANLT